MANYKVVFRVDKTTEGEDGITWEPGCPLALEAIQVSRNVDNGQAFLQVKVRNVAGGFDGFVRSFKAECDVSYENGESQVVELSPLDADIDGGSVYVAKPVALMRGDVKKVEVRIESVDLASGKWASSSDPIALPKPKDLKLSKVARIERYKQIWGTSGTARYARKALEKHDSWWLCPCGQINVGRDMCAECGASLEKLSDPSLVDEASLRNDAEKRSAEQEKRREEHVRKKKRARILLASALAGVAAIASLFAFIVIPNWEEAQKEALLEEKERLYEEAVNNFEAGNYETAYEQFVDIITYKDSDERAVESMEQQQAAKRERENIEDRLLFVDTDRLWVEKTQGLGDQVIEEDGVRLNSDGTIHVTTYFAGEDETLTWEGTWSETTGEVHFDPIDIGGGAEPQVFPGGEYWHLDSETVGYTRFEGENHTNIRALTISSDDGEASFELRIVDNRE